MDGGDGVGVFCGAGRAGGIVVCGLILILVLLVPCAFTCILLVLFRFFIF